MLSQRPFGHHLRTSLSWCGVAVAALAGAAAGRSFIGTVTVVQGSSMAPTYQPGATIEAAAIDTELRRGDIVLLDDGRGGLALKRIVGLPGEIVHLWHGQVFINRQMIREPYLPRHTYTAPSQTTGQIMFKVADGHYFVLGDNRTCSEDSRYYGPVERRQIKNRVPLPGSNPPELVAYTLPEKGKTLIRPL
jgi:signal peptidase I